MVKFQHYTKSVLLYESTKVEYNYNYDASAKLYIQIERVRMLSVFCT